MASIVADASGRHLMWDERVIRVHTILDQMVLCETLQAGCGSDALRDEESDRGGELVPLLGRPANEVLEQRRKGRLFERFLKILVSGGRMSGILPVGGRLAF